MHRTKRVARRALVALTIWALTTWASAICVPLAAQANRPNAEIVSAAIRKWRMAYVAGHIELHDPVATRRSAYDKLLPEASELTTHHEGLIDLLEFAIGRPARTVVCVPAVLRLAAVSRSGKPIHPTRGAGVVRAAARTTLGRMTDRRAQFLLLQAAQDRPEPWTGQWDPHLQAAALRALAVTDMPVMRPILERQCASQHAPVRLAAAKALHATGPPRSLPAVCDAMTDELDGRVAEQLAATALAILSRHVDRCETKFVRLALHRAIAMLGRTGDWRADLAVVNLCHAFRNRAAVEPLIQILERFHSTPEAIDRGQLSGILRERTHETLEALTGARMPADDPAAWREFWSRVEPEFVLAPQPEQSTGRTRAGFFGIPIAGTRVVFVIDRSGSMEESHGPDETRHDRARKELLRAVGDLPPDAKFKVITFGNSCSSWRKDFATPHDSNLGKLRLMLKRRRPKGATDLYGGLALALDIRTAKFGERYITPVDEIFLLSDGAPSTGEIIDTKRILTTIREVNTHRKVQIHTVFIGNSMVAEQFMRQLAAQNGGHFVRQ